MELELDMDNQIYHKTSLQLRAVKNQNESFPKNKNKRQQKTMEVHQKKLGLKLQNTKIQHHKV